MCVKRLKPVHYPRVTLNICAAACSDKLIFHIDNTLSENGINVQVSITTCVLCIQQAWHDLLHSRDQSAMMSAMAYNIKCIRLDNRIHIRIIDAGANPRRVTCLTKFALATRCTSRYPSAHATFYYTGSSGRAR